MKLQGRVAAVTGAAQGIGAAIVREFATEGATVAGIDLNTDVEQVCQAVAAAQRGRARPYVFDITDHAAYRRCVDDIVQKDGEDRHTGERRGDRLLRRHLRG